MSTTVLDFMIQGSDNLSTVFHGAADAAENLQSVIDRASKSLASAAESAANRVSAASDRQQLAMNHVEEATAKLSETQEKYAAGSSQVIRAEGDLLKAKQQLASADGKLRTAENDLTDIQKRQTTVVEDVTKAHEGMTKGSEESASGLEKVGSASSSLMSHLGNLATTIAGFGIGSFLEDQAKESINAFKNAQSTTAAFQATMSKFPKLGKDASSELQELDEKLMNTTKYSAEDDESMQSTLAAYNLTGDQIKTLTPLVQDLAAKTGQSLPDAAKQLGLALNGTTSRSLKQVGIDFKSTGSAAGNYQELVSQLTDKVGGYAQVAGGTAAGQTEIFRNRIEALQIKLGDALMPVFNEVVSWMNSKVVPSLQQGADWLTSHKSDVTAFAGQVENGLGQVTKAIGTVVSFAQAHKDWVQPLVAGLGGLLIAGDTINRLKGPINGINSAFQVIQKVVGAAGSTVKVFGSVLEGLGKGFAVITKGVTFLKDLQLGTKLATAAQWLFNAAMNANPIGITITLIAALVAGLAVFFSRTSTGRKMWASFIDWLKDAWGTVSDDWTKTWDHIRSFFSDTWHGIQNNFTTIISAIGAFLIGGPLAAAFVVLYQKNDAFRDNVNNMLNQVRNGWNGLVNWFRSVPGWIEGIFSNAGNWLRDAGAKIWDGFIQGVESKVGDVKNSVKNALSSISNLFPHSPAKEGPFSGRGWTLYSGAATIDAFAQGAESRATSARGTLLNVVDGMRSAFDGMDGVTGFPTGSASTINGGSRDLNVGSINLYGSQATTDGILDGLNRYARQTGGF